MLESIWEQIPVWESLLVRLSKVGAYVGFFLGHSGFLPADHYKIDRLDKNEEKTLLHHFTIMFDLNEKAIK